MVKKYGKASRQNFTHHIKADVIILGCSLPGIVTAHNLKKKFGDSVDIVILDLTGGRRQQETGKKHVSVAFQDIPDDSSSDDEPTLATADKSSRPQFRTVYDNVARFFLEKYSTDFNLPIPEYLEPQRVQSSLHKLFQDINGKTYRCKQNFHQFDYLGYTEKFELLQYQTLLDCSMQNIFRPYDTITVADRKRINYLDQTTMEAHMNTKLYSATSKGIMRTIVEIVCGTTAENTSVLFYLHQCYRVSSAKNIVDGDNARFREKLLGHFQKRLAHRLHESIADITLASKPIREIRTSPDERLIIEPEIGETDYVCNLLAMAIRPDQMRNIVMETKLVTEEQISAICAMKLGESKKFTIEYKVNFWQPLGFSGDILSSQGPIIWAMERPTITTTRSADKYVALTGYLRVVANRNNSRNEVVDQLVKLFGAEAANPVTYTEMSVTEICIPRLEEYLILRKLATQDNPKFLEWGALDIFAEGDIASALEAGHAAYLHLLSVLRPQAITYDDIACGIPTTHLYSAFDEMSASINVLSTSRIFLFFVAIIVSVSVLRKIRHQP